MDDAAMLEVFADVVCPFTHVGLRRIVAERAQRGRDDVALWVRSWPLEVVNGAPVDPAFIAEEVADLKAQVAPDLFVGFTESVVPATTLPALALTVAAYKTSRTVGERVALALRTALFEQGRDVTDDAVLTDIAGEHGVDAAFTVGGDGSAFDAVRAEHTEGVERGVVGSPHFFLGGRSQFCPSLDIHRDDGGHLHIAFDQPAFDQLIEDCFN